VNESNRASEDEDVRVPTECESVSPALFSTCHMYARTSRMNATHPPTSVHTSIHLQLCVTHWVAVACQCLSMHAHDDKLRNSVSIPHLTFQSSQHCDNTYSYIHSTSSTLCPHLHTLQHIDTPATQKIPDKYVPVHTVNQTLPNVLQHGSRRRL
jgi:hypothetical protein